LHSQFLTYYMKIKKILRYSLALLLSAFSTMTKAQNGFGNYTAPTSSVINGWYNTNLGVGVGSNSTGGNNYGNAFVGYFIGANNSGAENSVLGHHAFKNNTAGSFNVGLGAGSLFNNLTGNFNIAVGRNSLGANTSGSENISIGQSALRANDAGSANIAIGRWPLNFNTTGTYNIALGASAGYNNVDGSHNLFVGEAAGFALTSGTWNSFFGSYAGKSLTTGMYNLFVGNSAGVNLTNGNYNTLIGQSTLPATPATATMAGNDISNTVIIADGASNQRLYIHSNGNTGIGLGNNVIPQNKLEVKSAAWNTSGLRLTNLTNAMPVSANAPAKVLSVNATGDVILVNDLQGSAGVINNELTSSVNTMTSVVNGSSSNAPIVNSISNTIANGQLTTTVNGVASTPVTLPSGGVDTDAQTLSILGYDLTISNGNTITLPSLTEIDGSVSNELQTLTQSPIQTTGTAITLSNGGGTVYVDGSETKIQAGTNVTVTGAGTIASPYVINSTATGGVNCNIYTCDGTITPANGVRTVTMNNNNLVFDTTGSTTNGRVYIGNSASFPTTTGNYRLNVEGGILTEKVKVALRSSANWADYVFADNYKLMPLNEVEAFVKENKHLPGVASAENLAKEGLDLGQMQAKQMEKIEELTLYVIEQNKTIEKQSKEIEELKAMVNALVNKTK
jgi:trimeric autotransporter adhesin